MMYSISLGGGANIVSNTHLYYGILTNTTPSYANGRLVITEVLLNLINNPPSKFSINFKIRFVPYQVRCDIINVLNKRGTFPMGGIYTYSGNDRDSKYWKQFSAYDYPDNNANRYACSKYSGYNSVHIYNLVCNNNAWILYSDGTALTSFTNSYRWIFIGMGVYANYNQTAYNNHELYWLTLTDVPSDIVPKNPYCLDEKENNLYGYKK